MSITSEVPIGLEALEARLQQDLAWLEMPAKRWVVERLQDGQPLLEVAIIGGGMAGMAAAAALRMVGVQAVIFDRAPMGSEGPWVTTARMETLRSPKQLTGPALGLPALTFRAWFEAQFGSAQWDALDKIPRTQWMEYLRWYRQVLSLDIRNAHDVIRVTPRSDQCVELEINTPQGHQVVCARRLVMATGRDGLGGAYVPEIAKTLPRQFWAHSSDAMDYASLQGKRVAVVGAGASAMDSAATALEAGALSVDMLVRRDDLPRINKGKGAGNAGMVHGFMSLPEKWKWRIRHYLGTQQVPPPRGSTQRVSKFHNARFNFGCALERFDVSDQDFVVHTTKGAFALDFVIFSTGFMSTPSEPGGQEMIDSPDLGPAFEFKEKNPGQCPGLERIHCFCYPAALTHGTVSGDIPAISDGAKRLAQGIAAHFYREDIDEHYARMQRYDEPELLGDEWTPAVPKKN
jgi:cation diffusion facilitator CzcD-associated flavoprotein CzcO